MIVEHRTLKIGRYLVHTTHENRIIFPTSRITKHMLIDYYQMIAPLMLEYIKDRPLVMERYVNGIDHAGFYQKDITTTLPPWITTKAIRKKSGGVTHYSVPTNKATIVYLANQLCITPHIWLSTVKNIRKPDRMIFDLDPSLPNDFKRIRTMAVKLRAFLKEAGLNPFLMTTGSRGLHVVVPLKPLHSFNHVRAYAHKVAQALVDRYPDDCTLEIHKNRRAGKIFIDTLRNGYAQTGVAPYAVRVIEGAPVATPIFWDELSSITSAQHYTIKTIENRLAAHNDPWKNIKNKATSIN